MLNKDAAHLGMWLAFFVCTVWWNLGWSRYIKRHLHIDPPYRPWLSIIIRSFLAICLLVGFLGLVDQWPKRIQSIKFYLTALAVAVVLFSWVVFITKCGDWLNIKKQRS
jgi:hypothetical protein